MAIKTNQERVRLVVEVTENPGQKKDQVRKMKDGTEVIASQRQRTRQIQISLTDSTSNSPYPWVRPDFISEEILRGHKIIRLDGISKLPESYPKEWRKILTDFAKAVNHHVGKDKQITDLQSQLAAAREEVENYKKGEKSNVKTGLRGSKASSGELNEAA